MTCSQEPELKELNPEDLRREIPVNFSRYEPVASIKATNFTPWWGGGPNATTHIVSDEGVRVWLPTSETIKGGLRWVLRAAIGNASHRIDYVDQMLSELFGGTKRVERKEEHFSSKIRIEVESSVSPSYVEELVCAISENNRSNKGNLNEFLRKCNNVARKCRISTPDLLEILGWCLYWIDKGHAIDANLLRNFGFKNATSPMCIDGIKTLLDEVKGVGLLKHIIKLFTIPRVKMVFMGTELNPKSLIERIPTPPNTVTINIKVYLDKFCRNRDVVAKLVILSLIFLLYAKGIGKGTTRGFGRFRIQVEDVKISDLNANDIKAIRSIISELNSMDAKRVRQALDELKKLLINLAERLFAITQLSNVPRLPDLRFTQIHVIDNAKHPFPYPLRAYANASELSKGSVTDVYEALSAISYAVMKNTWKLIAGQPVRSVGAAFHTWILGLPRYQQKTGYVSINALSHGYRNILLKSPQSYSCITICVDQRGLRTSDLRRQSPIILFPVGKGIAMIAFKTVQDHARVLQEELLLHVGRHGPPKSARCRQVSPVVHIATCRNLSNAFTDRGCRPGSGCGNVSPCGIMTPKGSYNVSADNITQLIDHVFSSAIDFVIQALS